jgi:Ni/Fe-hydrogenase subunit HybB-like protein
VEKVFDTLDKVFAPVRNLLSKNRATKFLLDEYMGYTRNIRVALAVLIILVILFIIFGIQILFWGLGYTDMSNLYPFGQWIIGDLGLVALGGGAFTSGFVMYIFRNEKIEPMINSTVLLGFLCYLFTLVYLVFDIGQPLRAWFGYTYPNWGPSLLPASMLTEVVWCLTLYFCILFVEVIPVALKHKILDKIPALHYIGHYLHRLMWIFAAAGTFLSFFHQGSLGGGMWGVMYAKPFWFRPHFFFLAIVGATAGGTSFMALCAYIAGKVMKKEVVPAETFYTIAKISGVMMFFYLIFRVFDLISRNLTFVPAFDRRFIDLLSPQYGWMYIPELICIVLTVVMLLVKKFREQEKFFLTGIISGVVAVTIAKLSVVLNGSAVPNFPWKSFIAYFPTFAEWAVMLGGLSVMALIYMWCAKYLPLFPHAEKQGHHSSETQAAE